jgi:alanine racemase
MIKATINFKTILWNIRKLKKQLLPGVKFCAVVKANAYSLGDVVIARGIEDEVDSFAVANIKEAVRLRDGDIKKPILLFGPCPDFKSAIRNNIIVSIHSTAEVKALCKALQGMHPAKCKIHIKVNTGMNRYGISNVWQLKSILATAAKCSNIIVDGLYTHMAFETDRKNEIDVQLKKFVPFRSVMRTHHPSATIHASCSGSAEYLPAQFDMVRIGKIMCGGFDGYRTAIKVTSKINAVQNLSVGAKIGYNGTASATATMVCGVVPCGYADLAHFNFGNSHHVLVDNMPCKVIGRVCMDSFMIDVTCVPSPLGKTVTIIGEQKGLGIMDISRTTNTIACELLCGFNFERTEINYKN